MRLRIWPGLLFLVCVVVGCSRSPSGGPQAPGVPEVTWAHPAVEKLTETSDLTGVLEAKETVQVRPRVSGFILDVKFKDGDEVKEDDPLVLIDPVPYEATVRQAKAELAAYTAQLKLAEADLARNAKLLPTSAISREEYDRTVAQKEIASSRIDGAKAALMRADLDLNWTKVTAPISGKVDRIYITRGNVVTGGLTQGTVLTTIVSTAPIYAYFDANEQLVDYYFRQLKEGRFTPDKDGIPVFLSLPGDKDKYPHEGRMNFASPRFSPTTGSLQLRAVVDKPAREMVPGRQVKARIPISNPYDAVLIPDEVIQIDQGSKFVYVIDEKNRVRARSIKTGPLAYGLRVVDEGLSKDDRLVIKGQLRLRADEVVEPIQSDEGILVKKPSVEKGK